MERPILYAVGTSPTGTVGWQALKAFQSRITAMKLKKLKTPGFPQYHFSSSDAPTSPVTISPPRL